MREKKETKKVSNKGITLIALVITIIVLLILAAVSIATLTGDNGILTKAQTAKQRTQVEEEKEQLKLAYNAVMAENNGEGVTKKQLEDELKKYDDRITVEEDGDKFKVTFPSGNVYTIDKNGKIEELEKSDIPVINVSLTIKGTPVEEKDIKIPEGFVHVGGSINEGYVISDNPADANKDVDSELDGNQFVWVPVEKDQKITAKVESSEEITSIVLTDPYGDDILALPEESEQIGKTYTNEGIEPTINGPYRIVIETESGKEEKKFLNVHSLYAVDTFRDFRYTEENEDDLMNGSDMKKYSETEKYEQKVNTNGGFYIGRYEAGDSSANENRTSTKDGTLVTQKNKYVYNWIAQTDALSKAQEYKTNLTSSLLTGAAWDRTLGWLYETRDKTGEQIAVDSKNWGNYKDDEFSETTGLIKTGQFPNTKANNIYDLAGNVWEWTTEAYNDGSRVYRGGDYGYNGSDGTAFSRHSIVNASSSNDLIGFRLALYL